MNCPVGGVPGPVRNRGTARGLRWDEGPVVLVDELGSGAGGRTLRTQVAIVGAGPAGLVLAAVLRQSGVDALVLEQRARGDVEHQYRAGVIEHRVVEYLRDRGLAGRLLSEGARHGWCDVVVDGEPVRIDYGALTGVQHWIYPQHMLVQDLLAELDAAGRPPLFDSPVTEVDPGLDGPPRLRGPGFEVVAEHVVGCDGVQSAVLRSFPEQGEHRQHPYGWLTAIAELTAPVDGIRYAVHECGFAAVMPRSGPLARLYLQVPAGEDPASWSHERLLDQLELRLGADPGRPRVAEVLETDVLRLRSGIAPSFHYGRTLLAGDSAHVLTASGGKGMNLAIGDAADLADSLVRHHRGDPSGLAGYDRRRRAHAANTLAFSEEMLELMHLSPAEDPAAQLRDRRERVERLAGTGPEAVRFAGQYVGAGQLPIGVPPA